MSGENGKRRSERLPGRFRVEVREKLATWVTSTVDVSARGCRLELKRPLVPGMLIQVAFEMGPGQEPLLAHAQVAWVRRSQPEAAGLAFLSTPREVRHPQPGFWIDRLLAAQVRGSNDAARPAPPARPAPSPARANAASATRANAGPVPRATGAIILPPVA